MKLGMKIKIVMKSITAITMEKKIERVRRKKKKKKKKKTKNE